MTCNRPGNEHDFVGLGVELSDSSADGGSDNDGPSTDPGCASSGVPTGMILTALSHCEDNPCSVWRSLCAEGSKFDWLVEQCVQKNSIIELSKIGVAGDVNASYGALEVITRYSKMKKWDRKVVFLVPTVPQVRQIYAAALQFGALGVLHVIGNAGVDTWENIEWERHLYGHDLLVTTPQLFHDTLEAHFSRSDVVWRHGAVRVPTLHWEPPIRQINVYSL